MAYNLPNAWDPGFVLPKNVQDEGLERRAFITKQAPRGTYDNPQTGTGGFVVPQYIMDEGIGQGTFTTKWQPSGSYSGPKVPNWLNQRPRVVQERRLPGGGRQVVIQPLSDDEPLHPIYEDYGAQAAQILISQVAQLPSSKRASTLRAILNRIDTSLWTRTTDIWKRYLSQGVNPTEAFPQALARAMSAGIAAEIVNMGLRRSAPQAGSLLGLGIYRSALGADESTSPGCYVTLKPATATVPAHWERTLHPGPNDQPCNISSGSGPQAVIDLKTGKPPVITPAAAAALKQAAIKDAAFAGGVLGGFKFARGKPINTWAASGSGEGVDGINTPPGALTAKPSDLTEDQVNFLNRLLTAQYDDNGKEDATVTYKTSSAATGWQEPDADAWFARLRIDPTTPLRLHNTWYLHLGTGPLAYTTNPDTGENLVLHFTLGRLDRNKAWDAVANPTVLKAWLSRMPDPAWWVSAIKDLSQVPLMITGADPTGLADKALAVVGAGAVGLNDLSNKITDVVTDALSDLACKVLKSPAAPIAGAGAAAYVGAPPQAGVAGAQIGAQMCSGQVAPPPPPPLVSSSSILPLAIAAGGAVVIIAMLASKRKKHP